MDAIIHHLHHHNADTNAIGLLDSRRHSPSCFHARWTVILNNMSDQGECELISFCILPGRAFNFLSLQTPVFLFFFIICIFRVQHRTKTHIGTHSLWQRVCFLSKPRSPVLQISPPDNSDNPGAAKPSAEQIISLLLQAHGAAECRSASICVCFMMTLIGKSISGLWLPAWPYLICTWTCRLLMCGTPRKVKNQKKKNKRLIGSLLVRCAALVICYKYEEFLHGEEAILPLGGNSAHCGGIPGLLSFLKVIFFFSFPEYCRAGWDGWGWAAEQESVSGCRYEVRPVLKSLVCNSSTDTDRAMKSGLLRRKKSFHLIFFAVPLILERTRRRLWKAGRKICGVFFGEIFKHGH